MTINFKGKAKRLDDVDLPRIGHRIGVGEDELHAFMDVEAAGSGFDANGFLKMLFEPHVFYRELVGKERDLAVARGLAYPKWGAKPYPTNSYPRLLEAIKINETAALRSASWGLAQIMGFNHEAAGYPSPQAMIEAFVDDEETHVEAMVNFIKAKRIDDDLRNHNWLEIERVYNGGGHNGAYALKMSKAYLRWQKIKDTPWSPDMDKPVIPAPPDVEPVPPPDTGKPTSPMPPGVSIAWAVLGSLFALIAAVYAFIVGGN